MQVYLSIGRGPLVATGPAQRCQSLCLRHMPRATSRPPGCKDAKTRARNVGVTFIFVTVYMPSSTDTP